MRLFLDSINGWVCCVKCEESYELSKPIPKRCRICKTRLIGDNKE